MNKPWNNGIGPNDYPCPNCGMWSSSDCLECVEEENEEENEK